MPEESGWAGMGKARDASNHGGCSCLDTGSLRGCHLSFGRGLLGWFSRSHVDPASKRLVLLVFPNSWSSMLDKFLLPPYLEPCMLCVFDLLLFGRGPRANNGPLGPRNPRIRSWRRYRPPFDLAERMAVITTAARPLPGHRVDRQTDAPTSSSCLQTARRISLGPSGMARMAHAL